MKGLNKNKRYLLAVAIIYLFYITSSYDSMKSSYLRLKNSIQGKCVYDTYDNYTSIDKIQTDKRLIAYLYARPARKSFSIRQSMAIDLHSIIPVSSSSIDLREQILRLNTIRFHGSKYKEVCLLPV